MQLLVQSSYSVVLILGPACFTVYRITLRDCCESLTLSNAPTHATFVAAVSGELMKKQR